MENLYSFVKDSRFLVMLFDENGYLIEVLGDRETITVAESIQFIAGANWRECVMGTNAIGTSLHINASIQIFAAEHYSHVATFGCAPPHQSTMLTERSSEF